MILLFSGGYDSTQLALKYIKEINVLLHFQYDHPAQKQELESSKQIFDSLKEMNPSLQFKVLHLSMNADNMKIGIGEKGARYVPNRNAIFLSHAANYAAVHGMKRIIYGAAEADQNDYFDCTPAFIDAISKALQVTIEAPLIDASDCSQHSTAKPNEQSILALSWSCYEPKNNEPCRRCNSCTQERQ